MNLFQELKEKKVLDKDGKVDALGPYGKQKLTGREISTYFRKNKVNGDDLRKAVGVALDLGGAMDIARQEIKKFYGDKILKSKEVQNALRFANESVEMNENYRVLAKHGMGAETKNSIKVGTEIDYYRADGAKYMGKVIKMTPKGYIVKDDKNGKNYQFTYHDRVKAKKYLKQGDNLVDVQEKSVSPAQQAAIAIAKKEKEKKENMESLYREMFNQELNEEVANITVDPNNKIPTPAGQNKHSLEIVKQARRFGIKASQLGKHIRIKGNKKAVNDFLRMVIGRSSYGDPTEKDMSTPQIDKMLTKGLK
jgi:hypothetical protein